MNMFGSILFGAAFGIGIALGATVAVAEPVKVERIEVVADYSSVGNGTAATLWPSLADDIQGRLAAALLPQAADVGTEGAVKVIVTVEEVSLDGQPLLGTQGEFNRLRGTVKVSGAATGSPQVFSIDVNARARAPIGLPEGWTVTAVSPEEAYLTLVDAFARSAAEQVARIDA